MLGGLRAHQRVALDETFVELPRHLIGDPGDQPDGQDGRNDHQNDAQAAGDDPLAELAVPEVVPALQPCWSLEAWY